MKLYFTKIFKNSMSNIMLDFKNVHHSVVLYFKNGKMTEPIYNEIFVSESNMLKNTSRKLYCWPERRDDWIVQKTVNSVEDEGGNADSSAGESGRNNGKSRRVTSSGRLQRSRSSSPHWPYCSRLAYSLQVYGPVSLLPSRCLSFSPI